MRRSKFQVALVHLALNDRRKGYCDPRLFAGRADRHGSSAEVSDVIHQCFSTKTELGKEELGAPREGERGDGGSLNRYTEH